MSNYLTLVVTPTSSWVMFKSMALGAAIVKAWRGGFYKPPGKRQKISENFGILGKNLVYTSKSESVSQSAEKAVEKAVELGSVRRVVLLGRPAVSSTILYRLMRAGIPVDWLDVFGRPMGQLLSLNDSADRFVTRQQMIVNSPAALDLARSILLAKFDNGQAMISRKYDMAGKSWQECRTGILGAQNPDQLRGAEGYAARMYFSCWNDSLKDFAWNGRKAHPAPDPVNLLLSFGYGMLHNRLASALRHNGLNPRLGFFHAIRGRHCALASDLMEHFRPFVDGVVLRLVRRRQLKPEQFGKKGERCVFTDNSAFSLALENLEAMFASSYKMFARIKNEWIESVRSLNDYIDDLAAAYASMLVSGGKCHAMRLRPCTSI